LPFIYSGLYQFESVLATSLPFVSTECSLYFCLLFWLHRRRLLIYLQFIYLAAAMPFVIVVSLLVYFWLLRCRLSTAVYISSNPFWLVRCRLFLQRAVIFLATSPPFVNISTVYISSYYDAVYNCSITFSLFVAASLPFIYLYSFYSLIFQATTGSAILYSIL
jgi:hypothetical protein